MTKTDQDREDFETFGRLLVTAKLLYANAEGCAVNHYGADFEIHGVPGWLAGCRADIEAAQTALAHERARAQGEPVAVPDDGSCVRCGSVPRNASGLCATCLDEDAVRAGEVEDEASQALWRQTLDQERVPAAPPAESGETHLGWLYFNVDTGTEWSEQHPIESGEVPDATDVRPATLEALKAALVDAWESHTPAPPPEPAKAEVDMRTALAIAIGHIEHMAAWITARDASYSFEGLGEDMPGIKAALSSQEPVAWRVRVARPDPEEWSLLPAGGGADYAERAGYEVQPLYAHPAPPAPVPVAWVNESHRDQILEHSGKVYWYGPMMCGKEFKGASPVYLAPPTAPAAARSAILAAEVAIKQMDGLPGMGKVEQRDSPWNDVLRLIRSALAEHDGREG